MGFAETELNNQIMETRGIKFIKDKEIRRFPYIPDRLADIFEIASMLFKLQNVSISAQSLAGSRVRLYD